MGKGGRKIHCLELNWNMNFSSISAKNDVTKQKDLTGFYRYILNETTKEVKEEENENNDKK